MLDTIRWQVLLVALAGWVNRQQLEVIAYLREENRVLKEQIGGRRLRFTDPQRRRLAATGHGLGRRVLTEVATLVTLLASRRTANVTGTNYVIDGGLIKTT